MTQIVMALEGKVDFVKKTNPFGSGKEEPKTEAEMPTRDEVSNGLLNMFRLMGAKKVKPEKPPKAPKPKA